MATRIYTRTGDKGDTGLVGGQRVPKDDVRVGAYGTVDELNAAIGLALSHGASDRIRTTLEHVQSLLFDLGAHLATPPKKKPPTDGARSDDVDWIEARIDEAEAKLPPLESFILPGGTPVAAGLQVARAVCRRAERRTVTLRREEPSTPETAVRLLNRLSDLLFVLARLANHEAKQEETPWRGSSAQ